MVWVTVIGIAVYAIGVRPEAHNERNTKLFIIGGGALFPTLVLAGYLIYGLGLMPELLEPAPETSMRIEVSGEQWWWRVRYLTPDGEHVELANEIHLPVGRRIDVLLDSPDVIHSFWIPSLAGKIDMIPGRINRLAIEPTRTGVYRGVCAEYCGTSHAKMRFSVVVSEPEEFAAWLEQQQEPAAPPEEPLAERGQELFFANGCGACHTVRGTPADGSVGPELTHVGSRLRVGAGILPNTPAGFLRWLNHTEEVKPGVHMPSFGMLPENDLKALATYLEGLK